MPEDLCNLDAVVEDVLEKMFFSIILGPADDAPALGETSLTAAVSFSGTRAGALSISMEQTAAAELAASFLGMEEPVQEAEVRATFGELANVLCGAILGRSCPEGSFTIATPGVFGGSVSAAVIDGMATRRCYELAEGPLALGFSIS
jgi:hypothetical protein